jgi:hypothetical protein
MKYIFFFGWFLVLNHSSIIPSPYSSLSECKKGASISMNQYDHSKSEDRMHSFYWNCVPDQLELEKM